MSLAEDAVLERLNSVLEPSRTLVLAERGGALAEQVVAHPSFRVLATMNPGGDYGKRELSPALRSRFTEVWVPPFRERCDLEAVVLTALGPALAALAPPVLNFAEWLRENVGGSGTLSAPTISLRDLLTWARFIASLVGTGRMSPGLAFLHGAELVFLDGLGLGASSPLSEIHALRSRARTYLVKLLPEGLRPGEGVEGGVMGSPDERVRDEDHAFGLGPFAVPRGPLPRVDLGFVLTAPTTAENLRRLLRALQMPRPVLLEGSPGVGKSSLVEALSRAAGHPLTRINLSEQTDLADLLGADLPVSSAEDGPSQGPEFAWQDGPLLRAIKEGHWVLLDELNLASQAVLEGLNACLDHRAEVYLPELGRAFKCPPSFRVFAAQNPLGQGGGRKGLPQSFLNRFTKVRYSRSLQVLADHLGTVRPSQAWYQQPSNRL